MGLVIGGYFEAEKQDVFRCEGAVVITEFRADKSRRGCLVDGVIIVPVVWHFGGKSGEVEIGISLLGVLAGCFECEQFVDDLLADGMREYFFPEPSTLRLVVA